MPITKLEQILETVKSRPRKRLVAAWANDSHTVAAVGEAVSLGLVEATLVGDEPTIRAACQAEKLDPAKFAILQESSDTRAAARAVAMVNAGEAQILMKGLVSSDKYMRAILDKQRAAYLKDGPPSAEIRIDRIDRSIGLLIDHQEEITDALNKDFGSRSPQMSKLTDVAGSIGPLKHAKENLRKWMRVE